MFSVTLDIYEGPLDLLYYLIRRQRLSVTEVSLVRITQQFLDMIEFMKEIDFDVAADFLRIAAILIDLKSRELLPPAEIPEDEELDEVRMLLSQLEDLQRFKQAAGYLANREWEQARVWYHDATGQEILGEEIIEFQPTLFDLLLALKKMLARAEPEEIELIKPETTTVVDRMNELLDYVSQRPVVTFTALFEQNRTRSRIIITFLALLELIRLGHVIYYQREQFGPIIIHRQFEGVPPFLPGGRGIRIIRNSGPTTSVS